MEQIIIASKNPAKIKAVESAFNKAFPDKTFEFLGVDIKSGVADQPMDEEETFQGASNRLQNLLKTQQKASYFVSIESGCYWFRDNLYTMAWVMISDGNKNSTGRSGSLQLPKKVVDLVKSGIELGTADDIVFGRTNSKQDNGAIGILTNNLIPRSLALENATIIALATFLNPELY